MSKSKFPWHVEIPNYRPDACAYEDLCGYDGRKVRACENCRFFGSAPLAYPGGWCNLYPCEQVNAGATGLCDAFKSKITEDAERQ